MPYLPDRLRFPTAACLECGAVSCRIAEVTRSRQRGDREVLVADDGAETADLMYHVNDCARTSGFPWLPETTLSATTPEKSYSGATTGPSA
jgi:hypothetical protein